MPSRNSTTAWNCSSTQPRPVHQDLVGTTELEFTQKINANVDVLFLCLGHGNSTAFLQNNSFSDSTKIIDLSNDFRLIADQNFEGKEFIYGLPELQKSKIKTANFNNLIVFPFKPTISFKA